MGEELRIEPRLASHDNSRHQEASCSVIGKPVSGGQGPGKNGPVSQMPDNILFFTILSKLPKSMGALYS